MSVENFGRRSGVGIVAGRFVPALLPSADLLTGGGWLPWNAIRSDLVVATRFGGAAAAASMWPAQRPERPPVASEKEPARRERGDPLASTRARDARHRERASGGNR